MTASGDTTLKRIDNQLATVLIHLKKLLRIQNRLRSPLLRLPTEAIIHILSYTMEDVELSSVNVWRLISNTCHHIHWIMRTATALWWKVDCTWPDVARSAFARSNGNPQAIIADLHTWPLGYWRRNDARKALDHWRDNRALHGHRLHTLELSGLSSDIARFSWIFERPLPRLRHLKIHFFGRVDDDSEDERELPILEPVALQLPTDLTLRVLDLSNAALPWSSSVFAGLSELHLGFSDYGAVVEISADELLGILDASPRLESLSLVQVRVKIPTTNGEPQYAPTRIAQLPNLASLTLDNFPEFVGYTLFHMNTPAINSLHICSHVIPAEVSWSLGFFFPDCRLPDRLFQNPPVFRIDPTALDTFASIYVTIGAFEMQFKFDYHMEEAGRSAIATCVFPLVPPSVATLDLCYVQCSEEEWSEFFRLHPEVRSLDFSESSKEPVPGLLWNVLSPAGVGEAPLCPKLDSISSSPSTPLLNCLRNRKKAGFGLRRVDFWDLDGEMAEEFSSLVEVLNIKSSEMKEVCPVSTNELGLACLLRLTVRVEVPTPNGGLLCRNPVIPGLPIPSGMGSSSTR